MKKKIIIGVVVLAVLISALAVKISYDNYKKKVAAYKAQQNLRAPIEIPDESIITIQEAVKLEKPILALFYVDWCGYCRRFMPVYGELAKELNDKYTIVAINCDLPENREYVESNHIMSFPTLFVLDPKVDFSFMINMAATQDKKILKADLNRYLNLRKKLKINE